jgi:K+-transporting ATPase KdpF subunit
MTLLALAGLLLAVLVGCYLIYVMIRPERF